MSTHRTIRKRKWRIGEIILTHEYRSYRRQTSPGATSPTINTTRTALGVKQYREVGDACVRHDTARGVVNRRWPVARGQTRLDMAGDVTVRTGFL
jgi:hypothetical protein